MADSSTKRVTTARLREIVSGGEWYLCGLPHPCNCYLLDDMARELLAWREAGLHWYHDSPPGVHYTADIARLVEEIPDDDDCERCGGTVPGRCYGDGYQYAADSGEKIECPGCPDCRPAWIEEGRICRCDLPESYPPCPIHEPEGRILSRETVNHLLEALACCTSRNCHHCERDKGEIQEHDKALRAERDRWREDVDRDTEIINKQFSEMQQWRERAEKAEAEIERLRAIPDEVREANNESMSWRWQHGYNDGFESALDEVKRREGGDDGA